MTVEVETQTTERLFCKGQSTLGYATGCQTISRFTDWSAIIKLSYFTSVPDLQRYQASINLALQESMTADTFSEGSTWHLTHHFRFERWLNLSVFQFFPVNSPEKSMFPDVSFTFKATAKALCGMFSH